MSNSRVKKVRVTTGKERYKIMGRSSFRVSHKRQSHRVKMSSKP